MRLSVIIPTLNEARYLERAVALVQARSLDGPVEIIVADCGSIDGTVEIAERTGVLVASGSALDSRSRACNAGAGLATGDALLFLHADCQVPPRFDRLIVQTLEDPNVSGGAFGFKLDGAELRLRLVETINRLRYGYRRRYYGDQGIFVRRRVFEAVGGFPDTPILEDARFCREVRRLGAMRLLAPAMLTSPRRFYNGGILRTLMFDIVIWTWDYFGLDARIFADTYFRDNRRRGASGRDRVRDKYRPLHTASSCDEPTASVRAAG